MEVPLRTAYGQNGRCSMQPKPSSLRAQAQLKHELKLELVEEKQKLLDIREKKRTREVREQDVSWSSNEWVRRIFRDGFDSWVVMPIYIVEEVDCNISDTLSDGWDIT
ncbi:hypothetical protein TNCV_4754251 [Trichonephila clavipes]|nr:hypothetical protein TNCV_4754251 [Trichonephila clavipes]